MPEVSTISGMSANFSRASNTKTVRLRGSTGRASPAVAATFPAFGPAALITVPAASRSPVESLTPVALPPAVSMPVASAVKKSTCRSFSALRNSVSSWCASNQPSPLRPNAPAESPSVDSHANRL